MELHPQESKKSYSKQAMKFMAWLIAAQATAAGLVYCFYNRADISNLLKPSKESVSLDAEKAYENLKGETSYGTSSWTESVRAYYRPVVDLADSAYQRWMRAVKSIPIPFFNSDQSEKASQKYSSISDETRNARKKYEASLKDLPPDLRSAVKKLIEFKMSG